MFSKDTSYTKRTAKTLYNFYTPRPQAQNISVPKETVVTLVVPTYKPTEEMYGLIQSFLTAPFESRVVVVNDSTPADYEKHYILDHTSELAAKNSRVHYLTTPTNYLKPGASNFGLRYIMEGNLGVTPDVVFTCDDDTLIEDNTIEAMLKKLYASHSNGAVCAGVRVLNKNQNLLTRLQGLEYHGFNIAKTADNGFMQGPLVMQGMLVAFRYQALVEVDGFNQDNLIEDYAITADMKTWGWDVATADTTWGWTTIPHTLRDLWNQRIRWSFWGLHVVKDSLGYLPSVIQDALGHMIFLVMLGLIILSFTAEHSISNPNVVIALYTIGIVQFLIGMAFNVFTLLEYKDADWIDWVLRLSLLPELLYSNIISMIMIGSYLFFAYNHIFLGAMKYVSRIEPLYQKGLRVFAYFGYTFTWNTRNA